MEIIIFPIIFDGQTPPGIFNQSEPGSDFEVGQSVIFYGVYSDRKEAFDEFLFLSYHENIKECFICKSISWR